MQQSCDPRLRIALLFAAAVALTALCIAIPWLPYSPWNKPLGRYSMAEVSRRLCRALHCGAREGGAGCGLPPMVPCFGLGQAGPCRQQCTEPR